jgi:hypothetical protein
MLSELHSLNIKLCSEHYNKIFVLHLIVAPQLSSGWGHNHSTKTRQADCANAVYVLFYVYAPKLILRCLWFHLGGCSSNITMKFLVGFLKLGFIYKWVLCRQNNCNRVSVNGSFTLATFVSKTVGDSDMQQSATVLALATLGDATQIGSFLFTSRLPRWPRKVRKVAFLPTKHRYCKCNFSSL